MTRKTHYFILILMLIGGFTGCATRQLNANISAPVKPA